MKICPGMWGEMRARYAKLSISSGDDCFYHASNKCPYAYNLRQLFAGNLSLYRQGWRNSAHSAYSIPNRTAWSPTG